MNILIRTDSSSLIGTGHIMRDLVLAKRYKKHKVIFATQNLKGNINHQIKDAKYKLINLKSNKLSELDTIIKKYKIDLLIIDHYEIDHNFEKKIKKQNPKLKLMVLDDTYEKHHCDILLNHNISADKKKYKTKVPKNCKLQCGAEFTLLRDEFYIEKKRKNKKKKQKEKTVLIAMGGTDIAKLNIPLLKLLKKFSNIKVELITTTANPQLKKLQNYIKNKKWINLHINSKQIAKLMAKCDLSIATPSVTINEIYFMNLPLIAIKVADNQRDMYRFLKKNRYPVIKKFNKYILKTYLKHLL